MAPPPYTRPAPPRALSRAGLGFARDEEAEQVIRCDFVGRGGLFYDAEHAHLQRAGIGFLWAASPHVLRGPVKGGTAELVRRGTPTTWAEAQRRVLLHQLFGADLPTFVITL